MPGTILKPPPPEVRRDFKVHSNAALKAVRKDVGGREVKYLEGIASSTVRDRHGDTITPNAQAMMLEKARRLTMWLNHSYDVPEDILGTCEESELKASSDAEGNDILDLVIRCRVDDENPRAVKAWKHVEGGTQLGFSIGGAITDCEIDEENDDGTSWCPPLIINGLDLYEISLVGIPANPRSYTRNFVQEMSRGFMRNATRNEEVRKTLRSALPALRANAGDTTVDPEAEIPAEPTAPVDTIEPVIAPDAAAAVQPEAVFSGTPEDPEPEEQDPEEVDPDEAASVAAAHVAASEESTVSASVQTGEEAPTEAQATDAIAVKVTAPPGIDINELAAGISRTVQATAEALTAAGVLTQEQVAAARAKSVVDLDDELAAKRAELEQLSSDATQRAAEVQAAEAKLAELHAEATTLHQQIEELKATPTGRHTSFAGGSYARAYQPKTTTIADAQKRLGAKLAGQSLGDDPALRPA